MSTLIKQTSFLFLLIGAGLLWSCQSNSKWDVEAAQLCREASDINHRHLQLKAGIDSLWDATSAQLESAIPADFPAIDRDIFIHSRNADHMRMFMSFKLLDPSLQALVNAAGEEDTKLAMQLQALSAEQQAFEKKKMDFLSAISEKDAEAGQTYAAKFRMIPVNTVL